MAKHGKRYRNAAKRVEAGKLYAVKDAVGLASETGHAKFDETLEIALRLGVDPKHADQMVRGTVVLPHGLGRSGRVLVFAQGEKIREAEEAGADHVGGDELAKNHAIAMAQYLDEPRQLTRRLLEFSCSSYFIDEPGLDTGHATPTPVPGHAGVR